ncbi:MAG: hypothetical protein ACJ8G4_05360 [Burkholderiales bacterium]
MAREAYFFSSFFSPAGVAGEDDDPVVDGLLEGELGAADEDDEGDEGAEDEGDEDGALELGAFFDDDCSPHAARVSAATAAISRVLVIPVP